jgi:hypothetical protein
MSVNVQSNRLELNRIARGSPKAVKRIIGDCHGSLLRAIIEIAHNTLQGNVPIPKRYLSLYKNVYKKLINKNTTLEAKRSFINRSKNATKAIRLMIKATKWLQR